MKKTIKVGDVVYEFVSRDSHGARYLSKYVGNGMYHFFSDEYLASHQ